MCHYIFSVRKERASYRREEIMAYILQRDIYFCYLDDKHTVCKTQDINLATRFDTQGNARALLNKASKKLKNYKIVDLEIMKEVGDAHKIRRKQFSQSIRTSIYNKSKGRCAICGKFVPYDAFTVDHIIPLAKGGTNELNNLQCTCKACNLIKQDILPEDLMKKLTEIVLYQMRISYSDYLWKRINRIRKQKRKKRIVKMINSLAKKQ